jgi:curved DNA-binding protein
MHTSGTERRKSSRQKLTSQQTISVRIESGDHADHPLLATVSDASDTGLAIKVPLPLTIGSKVLLTGVVLLGSSRRKLDAAPARVAHCNRNGTGFLIGLALTSAGDRSEHQRSTAPSDDLESDYYDILQLSPKADPDTLHRVYRLLAQRYHPDNLETGNEEQFRAVHEAYRVLSDPEKRAGYDTTLTRTRQLRWKIFDQPAAAQGKEAEKRKRTGVLSLLYAQRLNQPQQPAMSIPELEDLLGCPREHLEFTLWYLREAGCIARGDNGRFTITMKGVDAAEVDTVPSLPKDRLLSAVQ